MNKRQRDIVNRLDALVAPELAQARSQRYLRSGRAPAGLSIRNAGSDTAVMEIYGAIGGGGFLDPDGISASDVTALLKDVTAPNLHVRINSGGGDYFQGVAIHTALARHPSVKRGTVDGLAASAATVILLACDLVEMEPGSMQMIHDAMTGPYGNAATLRREADLLDKVSEVIAEMYADRAGEDAAYWRNLMTVNREDGTWFSADEAVSVGLADRVVEHSGDAQMVARNLRKWESVLPEKVRAELPEDAPDDDALPETEQETGDTPEQPTEDPTPEVESSVDADFAFAMRMWHWQNEMAGRLAA